MAHDPAMRIPTPCCARPYRRLLATVLVGVVPFMSVSCGSDSGSATPTPSASSPATSAADPAVTIAGRGAEHDALVTQAVAIITGSDDGGIADKDCLREGFSRLADEQLQLIVDAAPDSTDPRLFAAAGIAFSCADFGGSTVASASATDSAGASGLPDPCTLLTAEQLATIFSGLGTGQPLSVVGPYGSGSGCEWTNDAAKSVTLTVTSNADISAWTDEASDGDGVDDGEPVDGIGEAASATRASISFVRGTTLVKVSCFPSFDVDAQSVAALASAVDEQL